MHQFDGRVAVITGAGSGIGEAMAWRFARAGLKIVIADLITTFSIQQRQQLLIQVVNPQSPSTTRSQWTHAVSRAMSVCGCANQPISL